MFSEIDYEPFSPAEEAEKVQAISRALERARKSKHLNLVYLIKDENKHAALSIIESAGRQTFFAAIFPQSHYYPDETPQKPLEIKSDSNTLTYENIHQNVKKYLAENFPDAANFKISYFKNRQAFKLKTPINLTSTAA